MCTSSSIIFPSSTIFHFVTVIFESLREKLREVAIAAANIQGDSKRRKKIKAKLLLHGSTRQRDEKDPSLDTDEAAHVARQKTESSLARGTAGSGSRLRIKWRSCVNPTLRTMTVTNMFKTEVELLLEESHRKHRHHWRNTKV